MSAGLVSIVLPVYNQADHLETVFNEYLSHMDRLRLPYELLPVINGPRRDRSLEISREYSARFPAIRTLCIEAGGWGRAVRHGLANARGDLLCYTNSARTTAKDLLLIVSYAVAYSGTVIKANRKIRESWRRRFGSLLYNLECRSLYDLACWDINGTPKVFPRSMTALLNLTRDDDLIDLEFNLVCKREGYPVLEVPILSASRSSGKSTTGYRSALGMYWGALELRKQFR